MVSILVNSNGKIKYSKYLNLVLNTVFYLYPFLIRSKLYILSKSKIINYRTPINLSLNSTMNSKR